MAVKLPPVNDPVMKPWTREVEKLLLGTVKNVDVINTRQGTQAGQFSALTDAVAPAMQKVTQIALAPENLTGELGWSWTADGTLSTVLTLTWEEVIYDLNGGLVGLPSYEVWLRTETTESRAVGSTQAATIDIPGLDPDTNYFVKVRAISERGAPGQFTPELSVLAPTEDDLPGVNTPSTPAVSSSMGAIIVAWDGESAAGTPLPPYFQGVYAGVSETENGEYTARGQLLPRTGTLVVAGEPVDSVRWIRLFAVDTLGRISDGSAAVSVTVSGVDLGTLGQDLEDLQTQLDETAAAVAEATTGPIDGTRLIAGSVVAGAIQAGSISAQEIGAGAITAMHLGADSVTANAIAAGAVEADHISAGTIQAIHLEAGIGGVLDISANEAVQFLVGQVSSVQADSDNNSDTIADMQTFYQFGPDGAMITTPDSPFSLALRADRIEILENNNVVSTWNAGQMRVDSFVGNEVILGNHKLEKYGNGTVVRAL